LVVRDALPTLGDDVTVVTLDINSSETGPELRAYADEHAFGWRLALAPPGLLDALGRLYGSRILYSPTEPMFLVDAAGALFLAPYGAKDAQSLAQLVDVARRAK
jgi:hypothetical protein